MTPTQPGTPRTPRGPVTEATPMTEAGARLVWWWLADADEAVDDGSAADIESDFEAAVRAIEAEAAALPAPRAEDGLQEALDSLVREASGKYVVGVPGQPNDDWRKGAQWVIDRLRTFVAATPNPAGGTDGRE